jgi:hypothetical protein
MLDKETEHLLEGEKLWLILMDGQENDPEGGLHLGVFIKLIEDDNIVLTSARDYSEYPHPAMRHKQDQIFMENLAERYGRTTR